MNKDFVKTCIDNELLEKEKSKKQEPTQKEIDSLLEEFNNKIDKWHNSPYGQLSEIHDSLNLSINDYNFYICYPEEFARQYLIKNKEEK